MLATPFLGEMLILIHLTVVNGRFIFNKKTKIDSIVLFSVTALIISILMMLAWGVNYTEMFICFLCLLTTLLNYRAIIRFFNKVYVDTYSTVFVICSSILLMLCIFSIIVLTLYRPVHLETNQYQVSYAKTLYSGSVSHGFSLDQELFTRRNMVLHTFKPQNKQPSSQAVLFIPDKRSKVYYYEPYLMLLAKSGVTVYAADFDYEEFPSEYHHISIIQRFIHENNYIRHKDQFAARLDSYRHYYAKEFKALIDTVNKLEPASTQFILVADGIPAQSFSKIENPSRTVSGCLSLAKTGEYKTDGFGFIESTDPVTAKLLFGLSRQKTSFTASYAVMQTNKLLDQLKNGDSQ